jgi:predicted ATPase
MSSTDFPTSERAGTASALTRISVAGYKSLHEEVGIDIAPLTIIAGANSAGKSSIMQPLLLLKQTMDASYDPGDLLMSGPNVRFTSAEQMMSRADGVTASQIAVGLASEDESIVEIFEYRKREGIRLSRTTYTDGGDRKLEIWPEMTQEDLQANLPPVLQRFQDAVELNLEYKVERFRCFLGVATTGRNSPFPLVVPGEFAARVRDIIHVPGLRGNPLRTYRTTAVGEQFPGTFETYVATVVADWQATKDPRLKDLGESLRTLGLSWKVDARQIDDTQVELRVGRLRRGARGGARDMVNIADVGFGVSQTLPVLVALQVAQERQLVYLEQPEIHLHPRAQVALAEVLANAARRGVRVVVETHSSLLLLAIQALVAEEQLDRTLVRLHWFERNSHGSTKVSSADLDAAGAFGNWPEDFGKTALESEGRYLDAAEQQLSLDES